MSLSPGFRAQLLQVVQQSQRALVQLRIGDAARLAFAAVIDDGAVRAAVLRHQFMEGSGCHESLAVLARFQLHDEGPGSRAG